MENYKVSNFECFYNTHNSRIKGLMSVFELCSDAIIGINLDRVIVDWNKGAEQIYGYMKEEIIGKTVSLLHSPCVQHKSDIFFNKLLNNEKIFNHECISRGKNGKQLVVSISTTPTYDEHGKIDGFYSIIRDVRDKYFLIEELKEQEERCRIALSENKASIWEWNIKTKKIYFESVYEDLLGYKRGEIPNTIVAALSVIHPEDVKLVFNSFTNPNNGEPLCIEYRMKCKDNSYRWFCVKGSVISRSYNGIPIRQLGICYDITEKKQIEEKLIKSEEKYRLLFSSTNQGILICELLEDEDEEDIDIKFTDVNNGFLNIIGAEREAIINKTFNQLRLLENEFDLSIFDKVAVEGKFINFQYHSKRLDKYFEVFSYRIRYMEFVLLVNDITERKKKEKELFRAKQEAEKANKIKSQFIANISHELRTPMNGILGIAQLLEMTDLDKEQREYLHILKQSSYSLLDIINQILDISKIEAGKITLEKTKFSLKAVIDRIINEGLVASRDKNLKIMYYINPFINDNIIGDELRLTQVLINLMSNAVKFTDKGYILIEIKAVYEEDDKIRLQFSIEDTGIGISDNYKKCIFEVFTQQDAGYSRKYGGIGLGLAISKELVNLMGGDLWFKSTVGKGSTFLFTAEFLKESIK